MAQKKKNRKGQGRKPYLKIDDPLKYLDEHPELDYLNKNRDLCVLPDEISKPLSPTVLSDYGARVKIRREMMNLSQKKLAQKLEISPATLCQIEQARKVKSINVELLIKLSNYLECSPDYLLKNTSRPIDVINKENGMIDQNPIEVLSRKNRGLRVYNEEFKLRIKVMYEKCPKLADLLYTLLGSDDLSIYERMEKLLSAGFSDDEIAKMRNRQNDE